MIEISSQENPVIKHIKQLSKRKYREKYREFKIEGVRMIHDALENGKNIKSVLFCDALKGVSGGEKLLERLNQQGIKIYHIPQKMFEELSDIESPQGVMAILAFHTHELEEVLTHSKGFFLILDRIQDPGNMGTMIRTADAAGADGIILTKGSVDPYNEKVIRSTMGSIFHIPILTMGDTMDVLGCMKQRGIKIVTTSLNTEHYHYDIDLKQKIAIIVGNEGNGVEEDVIRASDYTVKIPMLGRAESLNASVAASLMLYEVVRQRHYQKI